MEVKDFEYGFRFTDENYALFSDRELSEMKVVSEGEASILWCSYCDNKVIPLCSFAVKDEGLATLLLLCADCGWGEEKSEKETTVFLKETLKQYGEGDIFVCYSEKEALRVSTELFCDKWSDFCYPSDYLIIDCGNKGLLYYEDRLYLLEKLVAADE